MSTSPQALTLTIPNLATAIANTVRSANQMVIALNGQLIAAYHGAVDNWFQTWINHPDMAGPMPVPPMAYEVQYFTDPTTGPGTVGPYGETPVQWASWAQGSTPVCPPIPPPFSNIKPSTGRIAEPV